jgi:dolichyl-phosphate beta-glucosyltransferase
MSIKLSIIIPAYNEEKRIGKTLQQVLTYLKKVTYTWEILVVDDGSEDSTAQLVRNLDPVIKVIKNETNKGKGYAVKCGMLSALGDWRLIMDADNSTPIEELEKLWPHIQEGSIIIGSRYKDPSAVKIEQPVYRVILGRLANWIIQKMVVSGVVDTQCGFKLFSKEAAEKLFPRQTINRWGFDFEILGMAQRLGYNIIEVPVAWYHAGSSRIRPLRAYSETLMDLLKIKWRFMTKRYKQDK